MRVALLASTIAILASSPAFAQCVYVACNGGGQSAPTYQQPSYSPPMAPPSGSMGSFSSASQTYDDGYAAGLAARPTSGRSTRATQTTVRRSTAARSTQKSTVHTSKSRVSAGSRFHAGNIYGQSAGSGTRTTSARRQGATNNAPSAVRHKASSAQRPAVSRTAVRTTAANRATNTRYVTQGRTYISATRSTYQDPIKDRAATYRPSVYGQSTTMASLMSRSSSYNASTTTWSGPASTINQGGQVCGWGARIVTNSHGQAKRQAMWVCQCPQGWRPPGY